MDRAGKQSDKDRDEGQETFANGEARFKLGDQWYYRGNRSPSWFYVASRPDGSCQGGIAERVPQHLWSFLEDTARTISGLKAMGQAVVNTIQQGMTPVPESGTLDMSPAARLKDAESDVLRLHAEKMKFFERVIELERELAEHRDNGRRLMEAADGWKAEAERLRGIERALERANEEIASRSASGTLPFSPEEALRRMNDAVKVFAPQFGLPDWSTEWEAIPQNERDCMVAVIRSVFIEQAAIALSTTQHTIPQEALDRYDALLVTGERHGNLTIPLFHCIPNGDKWAGVAVQLDERNRFINAIAAKLGCKPDDSILDKLDSALSATGRSE